MSVLYALEGIRNPVLDFFFSIITLLGEETLFMAVGLTFYWCVNKIEGYYLLAVGGLGAIVNNFLKMIFTVPRPWVIDPDFTIVEAARAGATGYSFPSGHTQCSVGLYGGIAMWNKNKAVKIVAIVLCLLIPFSRLYLGVHTPLDVGVGFAIAVVFAVAGYFIFKKAENNSKILVPAIGVVILVNILYILFVCFYRFPESVYAAENIKEYDGAVKNGFTLLGAALGMILAYVIDSKWVRFDTKAVWWAQIIKAVGGFAVLLILKELLKIPLNAILDENTWGTLLRYFITVTVAGAAWPMVFRFFPKAKAEKE
ncbi:MAG: phosphatase PAP2 family protein [Clostridia bacterium]|nr:phosphatase PAP2 family protein [Clostridia bacterium]